MMKLNYKLINTGDWINRRRISRTLVYFTFWCFVYFVFLLQVVVTSISNIKEQRKNWSTKNRISEILRINNLMRNLLQNDFSYSF